MEKTDEQIINTFRRFGATGPVYQVVSVRGVNGEAVADILLPESGQQATVPVVNILRDPKAD